MVLELHADRRGRHLAELRTSWWRERGTIVADGREYRVYREGLFSGDFILESADRIVARATRTSVFRRAFVIQHERGALTLRAQSAFRRAFVAQAGDVRLGSITPEGIFSRKSEVDLPADMPIAVKAFCVWLTVLLWKRDADGGG